MKDTSRTLSFTLRSILALAAFAAVAATIRADDNKPAQSPSANSALINIDFPGGTLSDLMAALGNKGSITIVGPKADFVAPLPPFSLRNVHEWEILQMVSKLLDGTRYRLEPVSEKLAVLSKRGSEAHNEFISREISSFVDSDRSVDDIVDAITTACAMSPSEDGRALQIKYHPKTGLLLMAGPQEQLRVAIDVLDGLRSHPRHEKLPPGAKPDFKDR